MVDRKYPKAVDSGGNVLHPYDMLVSMPQSLPTPCSYHGCPELTRSRYCEDHTASKWSGDRRPSARERGYDARWDKVRNRYVAKNPLCEPCEVAGRTVEMEIVDHIIPLPHGDRLSFDNLQSMCRPCHAKKTARERGRA